MYSVGLLKRKKPKSQKSPRQCSKYGVGHKTPNLPKKTLKNSQVLQEKNKYPQDPTEHSLSLMLIQLWTCSLVTATDGLHTQQPQDGI